MSDGPVVVSTQPSAAEAELLAGLLRSGGVPAVVQPLSDVEYPTAVQGFRVSVPADKAAQARDVLTRAEHVDAADPASALDVGLPVDDEVRDYLAWRRDARDAGEPDVQPVVDSGSRLAVDELHARRMPLLPLVGLAALVVALVVLFR
jgi:hypothetical protein